MSPLILIIDDDTLFVETYAELLGRLGYQVESVGNAAAARARIVTAPAPDAVIVDLKLQGWGGPDEGLDLLGEVVAALPGTPVLLATGYASPEAITRAFAAGAFEVLEKTELFATYLRIKLQNALQLRAAARLGTTTPAAREAELLRLRASLDSVQVSTEKGPLLERLLQVLLSTIPGFVDAGINRENGLEEIDLVVRNESTDPFLARQGDYLLVECKNWSRPIGTPELSRLLWKMDRRYGRCRLGILVAPGGIAATVQEELRSERKNDKLVLLLDSGALDALIASTDRVATLKGLLDRAVV